MANDNQRTGWTRSFWAQALIGCVVVAAALLTLFSSSFEPEKVLFSNDAPLGVIQAESGVSASTVDGLFTGYWQNLNWLGIENPNVLPGLSFGTYLLFQDAVLNAKFYAPLSLLFLGFAAWLFFRTLGCRASVCAIGGMAAALSSDTFSHACWGLPSRAFAQGSIFFALAALQGGLTRHRWVKALLAGAAVGMAVMEAFDVGAIYSLFVAAYLIFLAWTRLPGGGGSRLAWGGVQLALVAVFAAVLAAQALSTLIGTQIKGVAGMEQDAQSREQRWNEATMWSLPKAETFRVIVPGLFGYRMDTAEGGNYWGSVGQQPGVPTSRHSGAGEYSGLLVILLGVFAIAQAVRKEPGVFDAKERGEVKFWLAASLVALVLAWGRHAPFYKLVYSLPYFSTIRNPIKFMHVFQVAWLILFALGFEGLLRLAGARRASAQDPAGRVKEWWKGLAGFDKRWARGLLAALGASLLGWFIFSSSQREIMAHLAKSGFSAPLNESIFHFASGEILKYLFYLALSVVAIFLAMARVFTGRLAVAAPLLLGAVLFVDLHRANLPWVVYYNYAEKYASNPILEELRRGANERRITFKMSPFTQSYLLNQELSQFAGVFNEWHQHHALYYNIPVLEPTQFPRPPKLDVDYIQAFMPRQMGDLFLVERLWQLANVGYIIGQRGYEDYLNEQVAPATKPFRLHTAFRVSPRRGGQTGNFSPQDLTAEPDPNGILAVIENTNRLGALKLFSQWETSQEDQAILARLRSPEFDPNRLLLVNGAGPTAPVPSADSPALPTPVFTKYSSKHLEIAAETPVPAILLMNDRHSANWKVWVDGQPAELLRCNHLMRGVLLQPGKHSVVMKFQPPVAGLYPTLGAIALSVGLIGFLAVESLRRKGGGPQPTPAA